MGKRAAGEREGLQKGRKRVDEKKGERDGSKKGGLQKRWWGKKGRKNKNRKKIDGARKVEYDNLLQILYYFK